MDEPKVSVYDELVEWQLKSQDGQINFLCLLWGVAPDVGCTAIEVRRCNDTTHRSVDSRATIARIYMDRKAAIFTYGLEEDYAKMIEVSDLIEVGIVGVVEFLRCFGENELSKGEVLQVFHCLIL